MKTVEEVPMNGHLPISALFKLGDPFLILKLCTTNKKAFYYVEKHPEKLEAVITTVVKGVNFEEGLMIYIFEKYYYNVYYEKLSVRLDFLRHVLDYQKILESRERGSYWCVDLYIDEFSFESNKFFQEFFNLFFGTKERVTYFFDIVSSTLLAEFLYKEEVIVELLELYDGSIETYEELNGGVMCYAYSLKFGYPEVKIALESLLDDSQLDLGFALNEVDFDFEVMLMEVV